MEYLETTLLPPLQHDMLPLMLPSYATFHLSSSRTLTSKLLIHPCLPRVPSPVQQHL